MSTETTIKERMTQLRSIYEKEIPKSHYVLAMIDGRGFSHYIKNKYEKPFDPEFINLMNQAAKDVGAEFSNMIFAYVQSDEITFVFKPTEQPVFKNRLSKLSSLIPVCASNSFNKGEINNIIKNEQTEHQKALCDISDFKPKQFDCKIFSCEDVIDVYSFILWRQLDCIRNSKQQTAQTYLPHRALIRKNTEKQIKLLLDEKGIDWNAFEDGLKYGRFIYKEDELFFSEKYNKEFTRGVLKTHPGFEIADAEGREKFLSLINNLIKPKEDE